MKLYSQVFLGVPMALIGGGGGGGPDMIAV